MTTKAIAFTPATVKERKDDPFDKEIYLQKAVTLVKEEFTKAASLLHEKEETTTTRTTEMAPRGSGSGGVLGGRRTDPEGKQNAFETAFI